MMQIDRSHKSASRGSGFALVVTLSLMVLLMIIGVGFLSLSAIALRSSSGNAEAEARQNARMAMMLALGELQKFAGPDQRVTAAASLLDAENTYANPHWTGVWRGDGLKSAPIPSNKGIIYRDGGSKSLRDQRERGVTGYDRANEVLTWLASTPDSTLLANPATELPADKRVALVGDGSASATASTGAGDRHKVYASLLPVNQTGGTPGAVAWAVLDDGIKARYDLGKPDNGPAARNPWRSAARVGMKLAKDQTAVPTLFARHESLESSDIGKIASPNSIALAESDGGSPDLGTRFHDVTTGTFTVLADTELGGLRRDLSQFLQTGSAPALGSRPALTSHIPIISAAGLERVSPAWGAMQSWAQQAKNLDDSGQASIAPSSGNATADAVQLWYTGTLNRSANGPEIKSRTKQAIHPVVADAGISYGISLFKVSTSSSTGKSTYRLRMHYSPRVVLYNPYDVKMQAASYAIAIEMPHWFQLKIVIPGQTRPTQNINLNSEFQTILYSPGANIPHRPVFSMPNVSLEPGEAVLFTVNGSGSPGRAVPWPKAGDPNLTNIGGPFALVGNNPLPLIDSVFLDFEKSTVELTDAELQGAAYSVFSKQDGSGRGGWKSQMHVFSLAKGSLGPGSVQDLLAGARGFEPLQYFNQTEDGASGSDAPFVPEGFLPNSVSSPLLETIPKDGRLRFPHERSKWGMRWVWLSETTENQNVKIGPYNPPWLDYNPLANRNILSNWNVRGPIENCHRASVAGGRYCHGPFIDDPISWDWSDPDLSPVLMNGRNRVSPFGAPGPFNGAVFPVVSVPRRFDDLTSIAALQHFPWSVLPWHPTFAVGNSLADPRTSRDKTTNLIAASDWGSGSGSGIGIHSMRDQSRFRLSHLDPGMDSQAFIHDLSYEANYALWDRYFLSTVPQSGNWAPGMPLANPRLVGNFTAGTLSAEAARDHHRAATQLLLAGGFNVNSTSVPAWAAVLGSMSDNSGMEVTLGDGSRIKANHVFSHLLRPSGHLYTPGDSLNPYESELWTGCRSLSEEQIHELAEKIVLEVKRRGPFLSLADFVNRRLVQPPAGPSRETDLTRMGLKGALQAALDLTSINKPYLNSLKINKAEYSMGGNPAEMQVQYGSSYPKLAYPLQNGWAAFGLKPDHFQWADGKLVNAPTFVSQADVLQKIGQTLTARSDTFTIRAYGDCREPGPNGRVLARAWCEASVQRSTDPLIAGAADASGLDPDPNQPAGRFGRGFLITSFRWLDPNEV